jgi:hypothetical protein
MNDAVQAGSFSQKLTSFVYWILRYTPNLVRDEWVNIGVLLFDPRTGDRRLRLIEEESEYRRIRRLHPQADEQILRLFRDHLEDRYESAVSMPLTSDADGRYAANPAELLEGLVSKWDSTLSNSIQLTSQTGVFGEDLDAEMERLYDDHVAVPYVERRVGAPGSRARVRSYCSQVFRLAQLWNRIEKSVRAERWTMEGDPARIDYSYRRNGTRGFVHTLSISRSPNDFKQLAYTADLIRKKERLNTEFAAVTDVPLIAGNRRDDYVAAALRESAIEPVPMENFAVWVAKLKPLLLQ